MEQLRLLSVVDKSFKMTGSRGSRRTSVSEEDQQSQLSGGEKSQWPKPKPQTKSLSVSVVPYIQRLCSNVQPANNLAVVEDGRLPQQKFVHYLDDPKGQFLGKYDRLLSYASNILCISPEHLEREVQFIEELIIVDRK
ncbi:hypothetical protein KI688_003327 [Linnemannia hyalina]|uniref:Uncharacterized protein n=1 Tax=Linnemannia hyalina TaxID=64524 RepID=A0A9P7XR28_9FUNG|nr:hypothetical protein KI688_003327 [Linnemannia hyalina]